MQCAEDGLDFVVDQSWLEELSIPEGHDLIQETSFVPKKHIKRRFEVQRDSSPINDLKNVGSFLAEKIMNIPSCIQ